MESEIKEFYEQNGYVVLPNVINEGEIEFYLEQMESYVPNLRDSSDYYAYALPDGVRKNDKFWSLIWHTKIINYMKEILGENVRFAVHNDIHYNVTQQAYESGNPQKISGWHRDSRYRALRYVFNGKSVWDESEQPVKMARLGIYLDDYKESGCSIYVIPKSHLASHSHSNRWEHAFWLKIIAKMKSIWFKDPRPKSFPYIRSKPNTPFCFPMKPFQFKPNKGDGILFDMRIIHGIGNRKGNRRSLFIDYGIENKHTFNHLWYYLFERKDLNYLSEFPEKLKKELESRELLMNGWEEFKEGPLTGRHQVIPEQKILDLYK